MSSAHRLPAGKLFVINSILQLKVKDHRTQIFLPLGPHQMLSQGMWLGQGFTVAQEASLLVQSFPHAPDVFALLKELAVMRGEPATPFLKQVSAPTRQNDFQVRS
jgi:hypothetical protein